MIAIKSRKIPAQPRNEKWRGVGAVRGGGGVATTSAATITTRLYTATENKEYEIKI